MKVKVIGYIRVSTDEQANHGHSLAAQEAKLRGYADLYDLDLVEVVVDAGQSAKDLKRPGIQQALAALEAGRAEGILVAKLDRLTRSVRDLGFLLESYFAKKFSLMVVAEQVDTRSATGRLMLNLLATVSQWEREVIGERTSAALQHKKAQGFKLGNPAFSDAPALARMRQLRAEGATYRAVCEALTAEGFRTAKGAPWRPGVVQGILAREAGQVEA